jgi:hypothetical protein
MAASGVMAGFLAEPGSVLYLSGDDGVRDTLVPRLQDLGADLSRVTVLLGKGELGSDGVRPVTLADLAVLEEALRSLPDARLLVLDPITQYLGRKVDMFRGNETRPVLEGLARLADAHRVAVLIVRHLTKTQRDRAIYRGQGSIDITGIARSALLVGPASASDPCAKAIVHIKSNLAPTGPARGFRLDPPGPSGPGGFSWTGVADGVTASSMLRPDAIEDPEDVKASLDDARAFLLETLGGKAVPAEDVLKQAKAVGISRATLFRAKKQLNVRSLRKGEKWLWNLPQMT